jgi:hypothetical protein
MMTSFTAVTHLSEGNWGKITVLLLYTHYPTPFDDFRRRNHIDAAIWGLKARVSRGQMQRYRKGGEITTTTPARLLEAASEMLGRVVLAAEVVGDLGESEPVADPAPKPPPTSRGADRTNRYNTRLDNVFAFTSWPVDAFVRRVPTSRAQFRILRMGRGMTTKTLRSLVITFRRLGFDVVAADIAEIGKGQHLL